MKISTILKAFLFLSLFATVYAGMAAIYDFNISQDNGNANLSWTANGETSSMIFLVERKIYGTNYEEIGTVDVNSNHTYQYLDPTIFKTTGNSYYYQILLVDKNNPSNIICSSNEKLLIPSNISVIKNTWGSIKAMFR